MSFVICRNCGIKTGCVEGVCRNCTEKIKQTIQKIKDEQENK